MTATTVTPMVPRRGNVTQTRVLRSEWTKLRSLRSTRWSLLAAVVSLAGLSMLVAAVQISQWSNLPERLAAQERAHFSSIDASVGGYHLAQLAIGVLGVLVISGEYSTGMIRSTLMAVPRRLPVLWAKLGVFAAVVFVLMLAFALVSFFAVQAIVSGEGVNQTIGDPDALRVVVGTALYLTVLGVLGLSLGALLRNTAAAISALVGVMVILPVVSQLLPSSTSEAIGPYLPLNAGSAVATAEHSTHVLAPWTGFGIFCAYTALFIATAAFRMMRRDA
ncbi:MAG: ABC transporter permease subunit [Solirubrobacteraceae bacterium]